MEKILGIGSNISTPIALGGFIAAILFLLIRLILKKDVFPDLAKAVSANIFISIINKMFLLSFAAIFLGFLGDHHTFEVGHLKIHKIM
jgi:hypothetical protein